MYVLDHKKQVALIKEMTQLRKDMQHMVVYYHQPSTNAMWKSYFPKANTHSRGPKILRTEPVPKEVEERLKNCLVDSEQENAIGLGIELSAKPEIWTDVMEILEKKYRSYDREHLSLFLQHLGVENYKMIFKELGTTMQEQGLDKKLLHKLARRSKIIRYKRFWRF